VADSALLLLINSSVWPSGLAAATVCDATMLPALGRFSTTTGWPSDRAIGSATARAVRSAMPPGANGTISVIGLSGKRLCARAAPATPRAPPNTSSAVRRSTWPKGQFIGLSS
jgi:hypothetical protein